MKGKMKLLAGALLATLALGVFVAKAYAQGNVPKSDELSGDIPAAEIVCDGGAWGKCHIRAEKRLSWWYVYFYCEFTGHQEDSCSWTTYMAN